MIQGHRKEYFKGGGGGGGGGLNWKFQKGSFCTALPLHFVWEM